MYGSHDLEELQERLGYTFSDPELLIRALTHRSAIQEGEDTSNERLEFLGDAVLGVVVTDMAYRDFPEMPEGELAKLRAAIVNMSALADVARDLGLGAFILLGKGEEKSGGLDPPGNGHRADGTGRGDPGRGSAPLRQRPGPRRSSRGRRPSRERPSRHPSARSG